MKKEIIKFAKIRPIYIFLMRIISNISVCVFVSMRKTKGMLEIF